MTSGRVDNNAKRSPFGELLVEFRNQRALTQEKLARAVKGESIAPRSITSYERTAVDPKNWVIPHRTGLGLLIEALELDMVDHRALVTAWDTSRTMRNAAATRQNTNDFIDAGREYGMRSIMDAWAKTQAGQPQFVMINGVTGIGKTTMARHASDAIAQSTRNVMITWGSNNSWATNVEPYMSIRLATDRILQAPEQTSAIPGRYPSRPKLGDKEIDRIVESVPLLADALISERAVRSLATEIDQELTNRINSQLTAKPHTYTLVRLEEYCRLLIDLARSWPIVVVLEDLHWAGEQTSTLLMQLVQSLVGMRDTPILIIGTYEQVEMPASTNGESHPFQQLLAALDQAPHASSVNLNESLAPDRGMAYVRELISAKSMPDATRADQFAEWLLSQTSGHPLLTEELVRHLKESQALTQQSTGKWTFVPDNIPEQTPSAISAFMEQRLSRVEPMTRRILDVASVMDDVILTDIVAEILHTDESTILEVIDQDVISNHHLLLPGEPLRLQNRAHTTYRFHLGIFREHVYNSLPLPRRRTLHRQIAEAMESLYTDADTPALSEITSHYIQAEEWHSAQMAGYRQAQHAALKLDWDLADIWFRQAEELALKAQDPVQLWRTRAAHLAVLRGTAKYNEALKAGQRIIEVSERHNWPTTTALAHHHIGEVYYDLGKIEKTVSHLNTAIDLHLQQNSLDLAAAGYSMLSHATYRLGKFDVAHSHSQKALALSRELDNSWVMPEAILAAANCEIDLGYYEDAIANYQMATELAQMAGRLHNQFIPPMNIGLSYIFMKDYDKAIEVLTELMEEIKSHSIHRQLAAPSLYMGYALEALGRWDEAAASYEICANIRRVSLPQPTLYDAVAGQMRIALAKNNDKAAKTWRDELTTQLDTNGWEGIEYPIMVMTSIARAHRYFGNEKGFVEYVGRAHDLLMERANMIENDESRISYLNNIPMNKDVQDLYASLDQDSKNA